ncbi:MAG TPA: helix-turn-helix domain-containing protein [Ktedonosporobacter sp.]|nr:helix-turn-helix domain-containing protein [Ktedonosporobacter sp.]
MYIIDDERLSDSPFVERVWRAHSEGTDPLLSIAQSHWQIVVTTYHDKMSLTVRGPETKATPLGDCPPDREWFGILFQLGTFLPHLPARNLVNGDLTLPQASRKTVWLSGSTFQFPTYENADTFVGWLVREGLLVCEPVVGAALQGQLKDLSLRTVQRRFVRSTGVTQGTIRQIERARYATLLLKQGVSISETILEAGYFDQAHLTRSMNYFIGQTPAQILQQSRPEQLSFLYKTRLLR